MKLTVKQQVIGLVLALAVSFGAGWWLAPAKVVTKTVTQEVVHEVVKQDTQQQTSQKNHKVVQTTETDKPDGTKVIVTTSSDQIDTNTDVNHTIDTNLQDNKTSTSEKTVTRDRGAIVLSGLAGLRINGLSTGPVYGGYVGKRVLGPITVGAFGLSDATAGLSIGLTF